MNNQITHNQVARRLEENDIPYGVLELQNGASVIVSQRGGRVLGPFLAKDGESILWLNGIFADAAAFNTFLNSAAGLDAGNWNLGGDRFWMAPEIQYNVKDRSRFWESYTLPEQVDPGQYALEQVNEHAWRLSQNLTLATYNVASGNKDLHLERLVRRVEDPLRHLNSYAQLTQGVTFAGLEQVVSLSEKEPDGIMSEAWNLVQLNPGGTLLIPASPCVEYTDYYDPVGDELQSIHSNHVRLKLTGANQYKVGYKAAHVFGRIGYLNRLSDGRCYLLVRSFFSNPSAAYAEEPAHLPGGRGHSVHIYNDSGQFGGFGELECNAQTIGGATGRSSSTDQMVLWLYVGDEDKLKEITRHLLGIDV
ncbi:MAG: hypothetical protein JXR37_13060 [Kiritimatiellae bacterium]|nr:hypothetical protein [Kiritimatiellia bacterium]